MRFKSLKEFNDWIERELQAIVNGDKNDMTITQTNLYAAAKNSLGQHLTLNDSVPPEVGCAEAASKLLSLAGIAVPPEGIPGTAVLLAWLLNNKAFKLVEAPEQGALIVNATGSGKGIFPGHCGVIGAFGVMYVSDWGICSNDSNTGTLREQWCYKEWLAYYEKAGGMKTYIFVPL